jgi:dTDP-glucose 4,6-dehydratase
MSRKKTVLCTGSCGFIFTNFLRIAVTKNKEDYKWASIDKLVPKHSIKNIYANRSHDFYIGDISDSHFINRVFDIVKPDIIVHGAANTHVDDSIKSAPSFIKNNVLGTQVLIDASVRYGVERFIYISTDEVYGQLKDGDPPWTEDSLISPRNPYSASKAAGEMLVKAAYETHGLDYNITRSCNNFGPKQSSKNLIPKVIKCILNKKPIPIYGQGLQCREWIHVADNCQAILQILKNGQPNQTYNITANYEISNLEMVHTICNLMEYGHDLISFIDDPRPGHDFRYSITNNKIKSIGWEPKFKFKDGLNQTCSWYANNQWYLNLTN